MTPGGGPERGRSFHRFGVEPAAPSTGLLVERVARGSDPIHHHRSHHTSPGVEHCGPERGFIEHFMRNAPGDVGWADYALFPECDVRAIVEGKVPPIVMVEAKSLRTPLESRVEQLAWYVDAAKMTKGLGVLTNGNEWWIYDAGSLVAPCPLPLAKVDITKGRGEPARGYYANGCLGPAWDHGPLSRCRGNVRLLDQGETDGGAADAG